MLSGVELHLPRQIVAPTSSTTQTEVCSRETSSPTYCCCGFMGCAPVRNDGSTNATSTCPRDYRMSRPAFRQSAAHSRGQGCRRDCGGTRGGGAQRPPPLRGQGLVSAGRGG